MEKINILGVNVDKVTISEAKDCIMQFLEEDKFHSVFTPNSEIIMVGYKDPEFANLLNRSELLTADGIGVVYAAKILGSPLKERAAGYDIAREVLKEMSEKKTSLYLFGGKPGVAEEAAENIKKQYPGVQIVGMHNGYFKPEEESGIVEDINKSGAHMLFVCLGAPAQEKWIDRNRKKLKVRVAMGIGGSLDVFAGRVERAPERWCKLGLEWLYRLKKEPWRYKRMTVLPIFGMTVILKGRKYKQPE